IGIRMALGAGTAAVVGMVLKSGMRLAAIGLALGVVLAFGATRLLSGMLYGISAADPLTYVVVTVLLVIVTAVACLVPARRATQVDPLVALRTE
ncbi:MAG TPA: FtsX-like permease family protein, partial [Gemmatimonadales bacterium]|nr:FtsX-like permease family protein [Gemmatimonadales bacterium]